MKKKDIRDIDKKECTGCMLCENVCPKDAISFEYRMGFWYPIINEQQCINCGKCYSKCPVNLDVKKELQYKAYEQQCYGVISKNRIVRFASTSGGFFSEVAEYIIQNGGYVCGAAYNEELFVSHCIISTLEDLPKLRKSKYLQSNINKTYCEVEGLLKGGETVLFCGTPCQVVALNNYLKNEQYKLYTMDFICCGISSPTVFAEYVKWLEKRMKSKIKNISFKSKECGWRSIGVKAEFLNGREYFSVGEKDPYMVSFVKDGNNIRESCYNCKYRCREHISDFTTGDFWGIENVRPECDDNMGMTALIVNTENGMKLFQNVKNNLEIFETTIDDIAQGNYTLEHPKEPGKYRAEFLNKIDEGSFDEAYKKYSSYTEKESIIDRIKIKIKRIQVKWRYFNAK